MLKTNEYFDGKVKSIAFSNTEGKATAGVISPGTYDFSTSSKERMVITSGTLEATVDGITKQYKSGEFFLVSEQTKFSVQAKEDCAYICYYG